MRKQISEQELKGFSLLINNSNTSQRRKTQFNVENICEDCEKVKNLNHFTLVDEIKNKPNELKIYSQCNHCYNTSIRVDKQNSELREMIKYIFSSSSRIIEDALKAN